MTKPQIPFFTALAIAFALVAVPPVTNGQDKNIVTTAAGAGHFETLVTAVRAAGLEDALTGDGPFTVFAPTDEAFARLPEGTLEALLEDTDALSAILTYHVVAGNKLAADVVGASHLDTLNGEALHIQVNDGVVEIAGAQVIETDIAAGNGVIHVIDAVMLPPTE